MGLNTDQRASLTAAKLRGIVGNHLDREIAPEAVSTRTGGAGLVDGGDGWYLPVEDSVRALGPALAWAASQQVDRLHLLSEAAPGDLARRAGFFADPPQVWRVDGRSMAPAQPVAAPEDVVSAPSTEEFVLMLEVAGVDIVIEHGVITGEVEGLEVARVLVDDDGAASLEVGVGAHDREAFAIMHADRPTAEALRDVAATVREHRRPGAEPHPLNRLAPSRRLRAWLIRQPDRAGASVLEPVAPVTRRDDLRKDVPAAAVGRAADDGSIVVVASVGIDLDVVSEAADVRARRSPGAALRLVIPERDAHPRITAQAAALAEPAEIHTVADDWHRH